VNEFLRSTAVVDSASAEIQAAALSVVGDAVLDEEIARRCFLWVRDHVRHSSDHSLSVVTCVASDVLRHRSGFCYAKSHLLAALLRARGIPAALCYQRLALDSARSAFCLHGLVAVHLKRHGWYRVEPRGNRGDITTDFCPPVERLAFAPRWPGELDIVERFTDALPIVVSTLQRYRSAEEVALNLPDYMPVDLPSALG